MKKIFQEPEVCLLRFSDEEVLTSSVELEWDQSNWGSDWDPYGN